MHFHKDFGMTPMKIYQVMIAFWVTKSEVCHAYRVNRWQALVKNWHVDGVTIVGVPFVV